MQGLGSKKGIPSKLWGPGSACRTCGYKNQEPIGKGKRVSTSTYIERSRQGQNIGPGDLEWHLLLTVSEGEFIRPPTFLILSLD